MRKKQTATVERPVPEAYKDLAALFIEVGALKQRQQEKLVLFLQGYITASLVLDERDKEAI